MTFDRFMEINHGAARPRLRGEISGWDHQSLQKVRAAMDEANSGGADEQYQQKLLGYRLIIERGIYWRSLLLKGLLKIKCFIDDQKISGHGDMKEICMQLQSSFRKGSSALFAGYEQVPAENRLAHCTRKINKLEDHFLLSFNHESWGSAADALYYWQGSDGNGNSVEVFMEESIGLVATAKGDNDGQPYQLGSILLPWFTAGRLNMPH